MSRFREAGGVRRSRQETRRIGEVTEAFYTARARVDKVEGVHRHAELSATGVTFEMGVHGPVKAHFGIDSPDLPLPVDYIVAATGG
jgi:hypothetical protein